MNPTQQIWIGFLLALLSLVASRSGAQLADVPGAISQIPTTALALEVDPGSQEFPSGGHLQGMQLRFDASGNRQFLYLSHDSATVAYLAIAEFPGDLGNGRVTHVHKLPSDGQKPPLRHAGGIQLSGDVLAVGVEDNQSKLRSQIQFWNIADPTKPVQHEHLTIRRSSTIPKVQTAGAVGIVACSGGHLVAVANWDSRAIDFYQSNNKPLADPACRFEPLVRWEVAQADRTDWRPDHEFGRYQSINLLADDSGKLYLLGFHTTMENLVDLYAVEVAGEKPRVLRKLSAKAMRLPDGNRFQYAAGMSLLKGRPALLSSPHSFANPTWIGIARRDE